MGKREGIMLCYPFEEARLLKWKPPYIVQPKLDGVRMRAIFSPEGEVTLLSSEGNDMNVSLPHIVRDLEGTHFKNIELDGEAYAHGKTFEEIVSITSREKNLHPDHREISYHVFDLITDGLPQHIRSRGLISLFDKEKLCCDSVELVRTELAEDLDDILRFYDEVVSAGYEGFIVRHLYNLYIRRRSTFMMKFKPKKEDIYQIIGYVEEVSIHGEAKGTLGALTLVDPEGTTFSVGTGFTAEQRNDLWRERDTLPGKWALVKYQHITTGRRVPRFPVFVKIWLTPDQETR